MIIRVITKMSLEDNEGNVIKEKEYGRAYLSHVDLMEAAKDWWSTVYHNRIHKGKRKGYSQEAREVYKIVEILTIGWKKSLFERFLCDAREIWDAIKKDNE